MHMTAAFLLRFRRSYATGGSGAVTGRAKDAHARQRPFESAGLGLSRCLEGWDG